MKFGTMPVIPREGVESVVDWFKFINATVLPRDPERGS